MENKIHENIFRAIEEYSPNNLFLQIEKGHTNLISSKSFMVIEMGNGKARLLPHLPMIDIYRGQTKDRAIQPSILRFNPDSKELMLRNIKIIDYELALMEHPMVRMAVEESLDIDFESLAQHYGLKTNVVDFTFDVGTAAFFATNSYNQEDMTYQPMEDGIGILYRDLSLCHSLDEYSPLGVQPFKRPHKQQAVSIKKDDWNKYNNSISKITFRHNHEVSNKINKFFTGINDLFPKEGISDMTNEIIKLNKISKKAISIYSKRNGIKEKEVSKLIEGCGYIIVDELIYKLSRQVKRNINRNLKPSIAEELGIQSFGRLTAF